MLPSDRGGGGGGGSVDVFIRLFLSFFLVHLHKFICIGLQEVLSVAFSADNRQIVSGSRDKSIKLWNTLGECKYTIQDQEAHSEWVSCVRFSPQTANPMIVSGAWDRTVKVARYTHTCMHVRVYSFALGSSASGRSGAWPPAN